MYRASCSVSLFISLLLCTALCIQNHALVSAPTTRFFVYRHHLQGAQSDLSKLKSAYNYSMCWENHRLGNTEDGVNRYRNALERKLGRDLVYAVQSTIFC